MASGIPACTISSSVPIDTFFKVTVTCTITGDSEEWTLTEVAPAVFRNAANPLPTSDTVGGVPDDGTLLVQPASVCTAAYVDDDDPGDTSNDTATFIGNSTPSDTDFMDSTFTDDTVTTACIGDNVYIQVKDLDENEDGGDGA